MAHHAPSKPYRKSLSLVDVMQKFPNGVAVKA